MDSDTLNDGARDTGLYMTGHGEEVLRRATAEGLMTFSSPSYHYSTSTPSRKASTVLATTGINHADHYKTTALFAGTAHRSLDAAAGILPSEKSTRDHPPSGV